MLRLPDAVVGEAFTRLERGQWLNPELFEKLI
jgi:hypothetical protein